MNKLKPLNNIKVEMKGDKIVYTGTIEDLTELIRRYNEIVHTEYTLEEMIELYSEEFERLQEKAKTEPVLSVELMRPIQMIYNLSMSAYGKILDK